ncbi:hypothetical protein [Chitinophaga defluvii]|uniref:Outer membrane protein with beta-barrel domain n=1 Tax=Chitinophaga defluvii TaxID=3163343 RepID=A0ABV2T871_9BACT
MSDAFENRIREKLNEADIPFDQDAWNKMDQQLDVSLRQPRRKGGGWWWPLLLLLLGGGAVWYWNQYIPSRANTTSGITETDTLKLNQAINTPAISNTVADSPVTTAAKKSTAPVDNVTVPAIQIVKNNDNNNKRNNSIKPAAATGKKEYIPVSPVSAHKTDNYTENSGYPVSSQEGIAAINTNKAQDPQITTALTATPEIPLLATAEVVSPTTPQQAAHRGISFGLTLGPDFNVAPSLKYGRIGFNAGALVHYQANRHWSFTTGAVYSKKIYGATPNDYAVLKKLPPPSNPGYTVTKIDAVCSVLDVPVNVNYTFLRKQQNTLSATLGASNYFMLKENYDYYYANNYPGKEMEFNNQNQHYIAILNVALTWQHPVGKHISLGVQPYAKIPFKGVGYGEVKLYSAGVALQVNFSGVKF